MRWAWSEQSAQSHGLQQGSLHLPTGRVGQGGPRQPCHRAKGLFCPRKMLDKSQKGLDPDPGSATVKSSKCTEHS